MYLIVNSVYTVIAPLPFRYAMADIYTKKKLLLKIIINYSPPCHTFPILIGGGTVFYFLVSRYSDM